MKKLLLFFLLSGLFAAVNTDAASLLERVRGHILLQVESRGEAWYVNPTDGKRYYMRDGSVAYGMMRSFGLGITDNDLTKIEAVGSEQTMLGSTSVCESNILANRLRGRILLQVEQRGEAWYVHPEKCRRIYMKDGNAAYRIMRFLSFGITNQNLANVPTGSTVIDTSSWVDYQAFGNLAPYNFTFKYPSDFVQGVDIGAIILVPKDYSNLGINAEKPQLLIVSYPLFEEEGDKLKTEDYRAGLEKQGIVSKTTKKVGRYDALVAIDKGDPTKITWFFTTYPDLYEVQLDATYLVPLRVSIVSSLRSDSKFEGIDEAIIETLVLPSPASRAQ